MFNNQLRQTIGFKFLIIASVILLASTVVLSAIIAINERVMLNHSLITRGNSLASYIAKLSKDPLIMKDSIELDSIVNQAIKDEEVLYAVIQDASGNPLTSQYASIDYSWQRVKDIVSVLPKDSNVKDIISTIKMQRGTIEVFTPITSDTDTIGKVNLGMSEHKINQQIVKTIIFIVVLNFVVTFIMGTILFVASKKLILNPIMKLIHAVTRFAKGELTTRVEIKTTGEMLALVESFNRMMEDTEKAIISKENELAERKRAEEALRERGLFFSGTLNDMLTLVSVLDTDGNIIFINNTSLKTAGVKLEDVIGEKFYDTYWWEYSDEAKQTIKEDIELASSGKIITHSIQAKTTEGLIWIEFSIHPIYDDKGKIKYIVPEGRDITDRKKAEEMLRLEHDKLDAVTKHVGVGLAIISKDYQTIWANAVIKNIFGKTEGKLCYVTYNQQKSVCSWCGVRRVFENGEDNVVTEAEGHDKDGNKIWSQIIATAIRDEAEEVTSALEVVVPITNRKQAEQKLKDTLDSLRKAFGTTVQVMVSAIETRDPYTAGHQTRSADLARAIATELGLSQEEIDGIRMAGIIHDIGKLSVPAEILSKPTKLTDLEFSLVKEHAEKGFEMLKDVESPWPLAKIVYQHHERMDGSGYPRNLKGDEILMESRIMAVADVVEAMASHRPYRPAIGIDAALDEIERNRGILYDNAVAEACLRLFREKGFKFEGT